MPGVIGVTVVTTLVCFFILHARLRAHRAPGIPCALFGRKVHIKTRADAARTRSRVWNLSSSCCEWSEAADGSATRIEAGLLRCARNDGPLDREWSEAMD